MEAVADLAERYSPGRGPGHLRAEPGPAAREAGRRAGGLCRRWPPPAWPRANIDLITDIIACPGLDYCALANARAIPIAQAHRRDASPTRTGPRQIGELKIKITGCINACGHHHVGHIGILGVDKKGEEFYQLTLGGSAAEDAEARQDPRARPLPADQGGRRRRRPGRGLSARAPATASASSTPSAASASRRSRRPSMPTLIRWRDGRAEAAEDPFTAVADDEPIPRGDVIISLPRFQQRRRAAAGRGPQASACASRPTRRWRTSPTTCRASRWWRWCSPSSATARPIPRRRCCASATAIKGEVRAVGDVLREQARFMVRCGFDAFEPADGSTPEDWTHVAHRFRHVYQRAADGRAAGFRGAPGMSLALERRRLDASRWPRGSTPSCGTPIRRRSSPRPLRAVRRRAGAGLLVRRRVGGAAAPGRRRSAATIPVLFLDTGMLFGQTLDYRQQLAAKLRPDRRARPAPALRGPGDRRSQRRPLEDRHRRLLPHPQGDAARRGAAAASRPGSPAASASTAATACACRWSRRPTAS